ncbi:MAG TPA: ribosome small subunit-dependent GTPase A [Anaerovoracaceae bacterium]|nr:ribosome small subunit-dependent GTPase A [Anaerovoracaceae bacterium]
MIEGTIFKGVGGFYYVKTKDNQVYQCRARGIFRKDGIVPFVGDKVNIEAIDSDEAVITKIHPRRNKFIRPPVSNVDCFLITVAVKKPDPNLYIVDKFLVMAEHQHTDIVICLNKIDLATGGEIEKFIEIYGNIYPVVSLNGKTGEGLSKLKDRLNGRKCAFAGPSGTGKSTILNKMLGDIKAETGHISERTQRGRHTTRHVELFELPDGAMIFDTPGFTSFETFNIDEDELDYLYPEMKTYIGQCRYHNCRHVAEPMCKVRSAVEEGKISPSRYDSYQKQIKEIQEMRKY